MEKRLIVVSNIFNEFKFNNQNILSLRHAAHRWGADFLELTSNRTIDKLSELTPLSQTRLRMMIDFTDYDKVLIIDPDTVINTKSPNIFDELSPEYDLAVVMDGNPGRFENYDFKGNHVDPFVARPGMELFKNHILNFDERTYINNYFNNGVFLYRPKKIYSHTIKMINLISEYPEYISSINQTAFVHQNLTNAWFIFSDINIKKLDNTWNWIAPDINLEFDMFLGEMKPNIYHFCGTDMSKERLETYDRWR